MSDMLDVTWLQITFPAVIPSLPEGDPEQDMSFQTQQQFAY